MTSKPIDGACPPIAHHGIRRVIEHPGIVAAACLAPAREARVHALRVGRIEKLDQPRQAPRRGLQRKRSAQRLIQIRLLAHGPTCAATVETARRQLTQPGLQEFDVRRRDRQLQRIKSRRHAVLQAADIPRPARAPGSRARDPCRRSPASRPGGHSIATRKPMNTVLPEPVGPQIERMTGILAAAAVGIVGVAGMQREVIRRAGAGNRDSASASPQ